MTISITDSRAAELEQQLAAELDNERANERHYLEFVKNPKDKTRPYGTLTEIRESIEILELKYAEAKTAADAERAKLPSAEEVRKLLITAQEDEAGARKAFYAAVSAAHAALKDLTLAHRKHRETIGNHTRNLMAAGIPIEGAELDGEPIELRGGIHHGSITLRAVNEPITYEWAPPVERYLTKE